MNNEQNKNQIIGEYTDTIYYNDGRVEKLEGRNMIVSDINKLIAVLFKNQAGNKGITHWAIGSGATDWDTSEKNPTASDTRLANEIFRKAIPVDNIKFIDEHGEISESVTNRISVSLTFASGEANGAWREFAIFGGDASDSLNTGIMINHKIHKILTKDDTMTIERQIRFTFN